MMWVVAAIIADLMLKGSIAQDVEKLYLKCMKEGKDLPEYEKYSVEHATIKSMIKKHGYTGKPKSVVGVSPWIEVERPRQLRVAPRRPFHDNPVNWPMVAFLLVSVIALCVWGFWPMGWHGG